MDMTESIDVIATDASEENNLDVDHNRYHIKGIAEYPTLFNSINTNSSKEDSDDVEVDNGVIIAGEPAADCDVTETDYHDVTVLDDITNQWTSYSSDIIAAEFDDVIKRFSTGCSGGSSYVADPDTGLCTSGGMEYPVKLNVGGVWHTTLPSTLKKFPGSKLADLIEDNTDPDPGYYFIDRDGNLFEIILNFLRSTKLILPVGFKNKEQLRDEARFYRLGRLEELLGEHSARQSYIVELVEICHPDRAGLCDTRVVLNDELVKVKPFCDVLAVSPTVPEKVAGSRGRFWLGTELSRSDWGQLLLQHDWTFLGMTSCTHQHPEATKNAHETCYAMEKWACTFQNAAFNS